MMPTSETWIFYRGTLGKDEQELAIMTLTAHAIKAPPISQYIELRNDKGEVFATVTFPSTVKVRKVGV